MMVLDQSGRCIGLVGGGGGDERKATPLRWERPACDKGYRSCRTGILLKPSVSVASGHTGGRVGRRYGRSHY